MASQTPPNIRVLPAFSHDQVLVLWRLRIPSTASASNASSHNFDATKSMTLPAECVAPGENRSSLCTAPLVLSRHGPYHWPFFMRYSFLQRVVRNLTSEATSVFMSSTAPRPRKNCPKPYPSPHAQPSIPRVQDQESSVEFDVSGTQATIQHHCPLLRQKRRLLSCPTNTLTPGEHDSGHLGFRQLQHSRSTTAHHSLRVLWQSFLLVPAKRCEHVGRDRDVCVVLVESTTPETLVPTTVTSVDRSMLICTSSVRQRNTEQHQFTKRKKLRSVPPVARVLTWRGSIRLQCEPCVSPTSMPKEPWPQTRVGQQFHACPLVLRGSPEARSRSCLCTTR